MHLLSECATFKVSFVLNGKPFKSKDASFCLTAGAGGGGSGSPKRRREAVSVMKVAILSGAVALILVVILALFYSCYKRGKKEKYDSTIKMPLSIQLSFQSTLDSTVRASQEHLTAKANEKQRSKSR